MQQCPVIFLAYANDDKAYLDTLKEEIEGIRSALFEADDEGRVRVVYPVQNTAIKDIYDTFLKYKNRVEIFHYAGHANNERIFTHQQSTEASSLAKLFQERKALELVFLNGCSSQGQVDFFLKAGAKAVIATSGPVQDAKAKDFSIRFYQCLAQGDTVDAAFNIAISELEGHPKIQENQGTHRFLGPPGQEAKVAGIAWGLYQAQEHDLDWHIPPQRQEMSLLAWMDPGKRRKPTNTHLVVPVFKTMDYPNKYVPHKPKNDQEKQRIFRKVKDEIVAHFPYPIAISIRALFTPEMALASFKRLQLLVGAYINLSRLLSHILLAQLWNEKLKKAEEFRLNPEFTQLYIQFRGLGAGSYQHFNYGRFCNAITNVFWDNAVDPFIQESIQRRDEYQDALNYLENIRQMLSASKLSEAQAIEWCNDAEFCLAIMLKEHAYLAAYELLSVRDIKVQQLQRTQEKASYEHSVGILLGDSAENSLYEFAKHTDSYSVLLIKSKPEGDAVHEYLNLCPFVIDENAFDWRSEKPNLLFLAYQANHAPEFFYERIKVQGLHAGLGPEVKISAVPLASPHPVTERAFEEDEYDLFGESEESEEKDAPGEAESPLFRQIKSQVDSLDQDFKHATI